MTDTQDPGKDELARDQARLLFDNWTPFARVSRRLLADLIERSVATLEPGEVTDLKETAATTARFETVASLLLKAGRTTPDLAWSVEAHRLNQTETQKTLRKKLRKLCRPELIWCDTDLGSRAHLEPMVHLLAYTIGYDLDETTVVVTLGPQSDGAASDRRAVRIWNRDENRALAGDELDLPEDGPLEATDLYKLGEGWDRVKRRPSHIFVLDLSPSGKRPEALAEDLTFDRVVHLTDQIPDEVSPYLSTFLDKQLFDEGDGAPYYCSFIASVLVTRDGQSRSQRPRSFEARRVRSARRRKGRERYRSLTRIDRDACVVPVDLDALTELWHRWNEHPTGSFFDSIPDDVISQGSVARWGRAVSNRRIGFALSGGGACAYRALPVLECLERAKVPIDVFAGLSGGALVGAYYCHGGFEGFRRAIALGPLIQLTVPLATVTTWPVELVTDSMLAGRRVEDLEVRLAAVAVALPPDDPPMSQVVVRGSLGEAVRVSGTLPPAFAKTVKGGIPFTDGGAGSVVPAQVARDFGADIVFACNAIPGPSRSNPFPWWARCAIAVTAPFTQRQIDYYAWYSYFWRQVSQRFLREADVAFEFQPEKLSMLEAGQWFLASTIVERARREADGIDKVVEELKRMWREFGDRWWLRAGGSTERRRARKPPKKPRTSKARKKPG